MKCEICGGEMGTGGCWTAWKHPQPVLINYDPERLAQMQRIADQNAATAQILLDRAERAERQADALAKALEAMATGWEKRVTLTSSAHEILCRCACDLRTALAEASRK